MTRYKKIEIIMFTNHADYNERTVQKSTCSNCTFAGFN